MSITMIEVEPSAAALLQMLKQKAAAQGLTLEALLRPLAETAPDSPAEETSSSRQNKNGLFEHDAEAKVDSLRPSKFATLHPNQLWLRTHRNDYRGQWVVLYQGELVAHGTDGVAAVETARSQQIPEPFIAFIPAEDNPFAGF